MNAESTRTGSPIRWLVICSAIIAVGFLMRSPVFADEAETAGDPDPARFANGIEAFERWDAKNAWPADGILFVGSSSIRMWPTRESFPDWPVINRGFGGAHISDVNHYFDQVVKPYAPRVIVFYCGDNDIAAGKSPQQVFDDYQAFTRRVHTEFEKTRIVYLPIKPSASRWQFWPKMQEANALIQAAIEKDQRQSYLDTATPLLGDDGRPRDELFLSDKLHLSESGYRIWNDLLKTRVESLIMPTN